MQLNGNVASNILSVKAYDIVEKFQSAFSATGYLFPLPILVDNRDTARALLNDSRIKPIIDIARQADVAILGAWVSSRRSLLFFERGVLNEQDYEELSGRGQWVISAPCILMQREHWRTTIEMPGCWD